MPEEEFVLALTVIASATFLVGLGMVLRAWGRRAGGHVKELVDRLRGDVEDLQSEVRSIRAELGDVYERMDFAERLLSQQRGDREALPRDFDH